MLTAEEKDPARWELGAGRRARMLTRARRLRLPSRCPDSPGMAPTRAVSGPWEGHHVPSTPSSARVGHFVPPKPELSPLRRPALHISPSCPPSSPLAGVCHDRGVRHGVHHPRLGGRLLLPLPGLAGTVPLCQETLLRYRYRGQHRDLGTCGVTHPPLTLAIP